MNPTEDLARLAGEWTGTNLLWLDPAQPAEESEATATVVLAANGKFVWVDYTWAFKGDAQAGSLLIGYEKDRAVATVAWVDSFHMSDKLMLSEGTAGDAGAIDVKGSYAAPPGPDWGWRTTLTPAGEDRFELRMFNITPDGQEDRAVEVIFTRSP